MLNIKVYLIISQFSGQWRVWMAVWTEKETKVVWEAQEAFLRRKQTIAKVSKSLTKRRVGDVSSNLIISRVQSEGQLADQIIAQSSITARENIGLDEIPNDEHFLERVIGSSNDLLSIETLEAGLKVSTAVGLLETGPYFGTAFLIGPGIMITNWHNIENVKEAEQSVLKMGWEDNDFGRRVLTQEFDLKPNKFFWSSKKFDVTIVAVEDESKLDDYGWLPLSEKLEEITIGYPVNIIQHPSGARKKISFHNSNFLDLPRNEGDEDCYCYYSADTLKGSSGSPVFNKYWEVIALHRSGVPKTKNGLVELKNGKLVKKAQMSEYDKEIYWIGNQGVRISAILKEFRSAKLKNSSYDQIRSSLFDLWGNHKIHSKIHV